MNNFSKVHTSVQCLPGIFQIRKMVCCLACALKDYRFDENFIQFIDAGGYSIEDIMDPTDQALEAMMTTFEKKKRESVEAICKSIVDVHPGVPGPLMHRRYYQKEILELYHEELLGEFQRGQILEIFKKKRSSATALNVIENLKRDFMTVVKPGNGYRHLRRVNFDKFVGISTNDNVLSVCARNINRITTHCFEQNWGNTSFQRILEEFQEFLSNYTRISMIVVHNIYSNEPTIPCINQWLTMFEHTFGNLDDIIIVFEIVYMDFIKFDLDNKADVRHQINRNVQRNTRERIIYLDVSPTSEQIRGEGPERPVEVLRLDG